MASAAVACGPDHDAAAASASRLRRTAIAEIAERLRRGQAAGELAGDADPDALARLFGAVLQGMTVQARDGATEAELAAVADAAMRAWPAS